MLTITFRPSLAKNTLMLAMRTASDCRFIPTSRCRDEPAVDLLSMSPIERLKEVTNRRLRFRYELEVGGDVSKPFAYP